MFKAKLCTHTDSSLNDRLRCGARDRQIEIETYRYMDRNIYKQTEIKIGRQTELHRL